LKKKYYNNPIPMSEKGAYFSFPKRDAKVFKKSGLKLI